MNSKNLQFTISDKEMEIKLKNILKDMIADNAIYFALLDARRQYLSVLEKEFWPDDLKCKILKKKLANTELLLWKSGYDSIHILTDEEKKEEKFLPNLNFLEFEEMYKKRITTLLTNIF